MATSEQGVEYIAEPMTPSEQLALLVPDTYVAVVPMSADVPANGEAFWDAANAAVLGGLGAWHLQSDTDPRRVGWLDSDTVLWRIACYADEDDIRGTYAAEAFDR